MSPRSRNLRPLLPAILLTTLVASARADRLDMLGMGILAGDLGSSAFDINDSGELTGFSSGYERGRTHGVLWSRTGGLTKTGNLPLAMNSEGRGLNNEGVVVGNSDLWPFVWRKATGISPLVLPTGRAGGSANDVNNSGLIIGFANLTRTTEPVPVYWDGKGGVHVLPLLAGGFQGEARRASDENHIVGWSESGTGRRAVLWSGKGVTNLGVLAGHWASEANGVNVYGTVVGSSTGAVGRTAFVWDAQKGMRALPKPAGIAEAWANAVSRNGVIVGAGRGRYGGVFALVWKNGAVTLLNSVAPKSKVAFAIFDAASINDLDQLAGSWIRVGIRSRGFMGKVVR